VEKVKHGLFLTSPHVDRETLISRKGRRVTGTCEWIIQHPSYQSWLQNGEQLLWISGGPGKGKTMMSIFLTEELERVASTSTDVKAIFYFCSIQDEKRNTALAILRSLVHQIITQTPDLARHAQSHFETDERKRQTLSSFETLWIILKSIATDKGLPTTFCVLDGLDESDEQALELLVPRLIELTSMAPSSTSSSAFRLAIVSRDIRSLNGCMRIKLDPDHDDDVAHDINSFVSAMTEGLPAPAGGEIAFRSHIRKILLERAKGTFLWVGFAIHELRKRRTSTEILAALEDLPSGLGNIYGAMLLRIPSDQREMSSKILMWVTMAFRPLRLEELAAAADIRSSSSMITRKQAVRDAVHLCAPFLQMQIEEHCHQGEFHHHHGKVYLRFPREMPKTEHVNLIHASARDYLVRKEIDDNPTLEEFRIKKEEASLNIARTCLRCITSSGLQQRPVPLEDDIETRGPSLLRYSSFHWYEHVKLCPTVAMELFSTFRDFFRRHSEVRDNWYTSLCYRRPPPQLHVASQFGIIPWIAWILQRPKWVPTLNLRKNERNNNAETALHMAISHGQEEAARLLINEGIDLLAEDRFGISALDLAIDKESNRTVLQLIKNGAATNGRKIPQFPNAIGTSINRKDDSGFTVLHYAAQAGLKSETRILIKNGANVKARDKNSTTALHYAAENRHEALVRILIASGADTDAKNRWGETPLHLAVGNPYGCDEVVRVLLEHGADVDARSKSGFTALHKATAWGHECTVQTLLDHRANLEAKNNSGDATLRLGADCGKKEAVPILLEHGADIEAKTNKGETARGFTIELENDRVVQLLYQAREARANQPQS
jgi:ankyrin repeat protein